MQDKVKYIDDFYKLFKAVQTLSKNNKKPYAFISNTEICEYACYNYITDEQMDIGKINIDINDTQTAYIVLIDNMTVSVSPITSGDNALLKKAKGVYIDIDVAKQNIVDACKEAGKNILLFTLDDDYDTKGDKKVKNDVKITKDDNGDMQGFSMSYNDDDRFSSFSFYSTNEKIVRSMIDRIKAVINEK